MGLRDRRVRWEAFRGHGVSWSEWRVGPRLPLVAGHGGGVVVNFESFTDTYLVDIIYIKTRNMALEKRHALEELTLDAFGVATRRKCLTMAVLLLASSAGGRTSRTSWIL